MAGLQGHIVTDRDALRNPESLDIFKDIQELKI